MNETLQTPWQANAGSEHPTNEPSHGERCDTFFGFSFSIFRPLSAGRTMKRKTNAFYIVSLPSRTWIRLRLNALAWIWSA